MESLYGLSLGLVLFLCTLKAYTVGLQHGKDMAKGNAPNVNLNPVKAIADTVTEIKEETEQSRQEAEFNQQFDEVFGYTRRRVVSED